MRDREHDGQGMTGTSYRVPNKPMVPGGKADEKDFRILESMPVRSIITSPANGTRLPAGTREVALRGAAWAGDLTVARVDVSTDFGQTWTQATLAPTRNRYDWNRWTATVQLPSDGYYEIWARATDSNGQDAAAGGGRLEPAGLWRQRHAPGRHPGRLSDRWRATACRSRCWLLLGLGRDRGAGAGAGACAGLHADGRADRGPAGRSRAGRNVRPVHGLPRLQAGRRTRA